jgi:hypothetical protein
MCATWTIISGLPALGAAYREVMGRHFPAMAVVEVSRLYEPLRGWRSRPRCCRSDRVLSADHARGRAAALLDRESAAAARRASERAAFA